MSSAAQVLCGLTTLSVSGSQGHLMQHKTSPVLHLSVCPKPWGQETKNKQAIAVEVPKIRGFHSWLVVRWSYCLGPGFPKHTCCNTDSREDCVPLKAALHTSVLFTNSTSRGNYLNLQPDFPFGGV